MTKKNSSKSSKGKSGNTRQISPAKHWFLTFNNYTKDAIEFFCADSSIIRHCFQEEVGETGTPHLQGHFEFENKIRPSGYFKGTPCENAHWEKTKNRKASIRYCSKLDTRSGGTFIKGFPRSLFRKVTCLKRSEFYEFQEDIVKLCETEPDDRTINWYWEAEGNRGKSALVKYLVMNNHAMLVSGKSADIKYQISNAEFPPDIIIYDIPRTAKYHINYNALEEIKNGIFSSTKYESKMCIIPSPHIICFANFEPDTTMMSADRWNIINI